MLNEKVDFDLSQLTLEDLIEVYNKIEEFIEFLNGSKIATEEKGDSDDKFNQKIIFTTTIRADFPTLAFIIIFQRSEVYISLL